jgi:hypothetical protein
MRMPAVPTVATRSSMTSTPSSLPAIERGAWIGADPARHVVGGEPGQFERRFRGPGGA